MNTSKINNKIRGAKERRDGPESRTWTRSGSSLKLWVRLLTAGTLTRCGRKMLRYSFWSAANRIAKFRYESHEVSWKTVMLETKSTYGSSYGSGLKSMGI